MMAGQRVYTKPYSTPQHAEAYLKTENVRQPTTTIIAALVGRVSAATTYPKPNAVNVSAA